MAVFAYYQYIFMGGSEKVPKLDYITFEWSLTNLLLHNWS